MCHTEGDKSLVCQGITLNKFFESTCIVIMLLFCRLPDVDDWMVSVVKVTDDEELFVFVHEVVPRLAPLEGAALAVLYHLLVPVGQHVPGEPRAQLDHAYPEVGVVDLEVVGDAPHDDQVDILLLQLPGDGAAGPGELGLLVIDHHHHLAVGGEHLSLVVTWIHQTQ